MSEHSCEGFQNHLVQLDVTTVDWNRLDRAAGDCEDCRAQVNVLRLLHEDAQDPMLHLDRERMNELRDAVAPNPRRFIPHTMVAAAAAVLAVFIVLSNTGPGVAPSPSNVVNHAPPASRPTEAEINELADVEPMDKLLYIIQRRALLDFDFGQAESRNDAADTTSKRMKRLRKRMRSLRSELTSS